MEHSFETLIGVLKAAAEPTRLRALALLRGGELSVGELTQILGLSQPRLSQHMKLLTLAGLVERLPEGAWVFYRLAPDGSARAMTETIFSFFPENDSVLARDQDRLAEARAQRRAAAQAYFERAAGEWDRLRAEFYPGVNLEAAIRNAVGPGPFDFMVDLGTGTGRLLEAFGDRVKAAEGIDLSHPMLQIARANLEAAGLSRLRVRKADILDLPLANECADLVTMQQVLHYLDQPQRAVAEALRIAKPGATIAIADFGRHEVEALRTDHAHRRLGFNDEDIDGWARASGGGRVTRCKRAEPAGQPGAPPVRIWTIVKAARS